MGYEIHSRYGYVNVDTVVSNKFLPATAVVGDGSVLGSVGPPDLSLTYMQQNLPSVAVAGDGVVGVSGLSAAVDPTIPIFLYRRSLSDYQDVARTTPAAVGDNVRSATDTVSSPHHLARASGAVPTAASGGGLAFAASGGMELNNTIVIPQPFLVLVRMKYNTSSDYFVLSDRGGPDACYVRMGGSTLYLRSNATVASAAAMSTGVTEVVGGLFNGASSKSVVGSSIAAITLGTTGIGTGLRVGCYSPGLGTYSLDGTVTDIGIWSGVFTDPQIASFVALLNSAPLHVYTGE